MDISLMNPTSLSFIGKVNKWMEKYQKKKNEKTTFEPHYSPMMVHNNIVYVSGQLPIIKETKKPISSDIKEQTKFTLQKISNILEEVGSKITQVLKATIYIADIEFWDDVNEIYADFFKEHKPARTIVPTKTLHYNCLIEIDVIAYID